MEQTTETARQTRPGRDLCVPCGGGLVNLRVGAIILKDGKLLMAGNRLHPEYLYSVGGRIKFGETAEEAVVREVFEETGVRMAVERLGFVHENYFYGDMKSNQGKLIYEIAFYFYMKTPPDFDPVCRSWAVNGGEEFLEWMPLDRMRPAFPAFFFSELSHPDPSVRHIVTQELP